MKKYQSVIKDLNTKLEELKQFAEDKIKNLDENKKEQISELLDKTATAIDNAVEKIEELGKQKIDEEKFKEFLNKVANKANESIDFAKAKINEIILDDDKNLNDVFENISAEFDKVRESDLFKKASEVVNDIGNGINEFLEKPEVKETIKKVKITTINIAEKGLDGLKKVLNTDEESSVDDIIDEVDKDEK